MKKCSIIAFILLFSACDLTKLNEDTKQPVNVSGNSLFTAAQVDFGNFVGQGALYFGFKCYPQHWAMTADTRLDRYFLNVAGNINNMWATFYSSILVNLKTAENKVESNDTLTEIGRNNKLASIHVLQILAYASLVDTFGNVPYSEAVNPDIPNPIFDDAQKIYMDLLSRLNQAIDNFDPSAEGFGSSDIIYEGNIAKWIRFANSLKMRLAITIADVNSAAAQTAIEEASPNAFTSNADNALIRFTSTPPNTNPVWTYIVQNGRRDNVPSKSLVDRMNDRNDPRRAELFTKYNGSYLGGINGESNSYNSFSHFSDKIKQKDRAESIIDYDEVEFIRAEAVARGYNVSGSVASHYEKGIRADMEFWDVPDSEIESYLAQPMVAYTTSQGDYRQKIGLQKWIALFMQGLRAWTEVRRLDTPNLKVPVDAAINGYLERYTYPPRSQDLNDVNYGEAAKAIGGDKLSTKIFWDAL